MTNCFKLILFYLQLYNYICSIRSSIFDFCTEINIEWRPAGEFVQGGVSNVQRHGFAALNIDHLPKELKRLFKKAGIKKKQLKKNPELVHKILAVSIQSDAGAM